MPATAEHDIRDPRFAFPGDVEKAAGLAVGDRVWLDRDKRPFTVRARSERYVIVTKPFNLQRTVLYTVMDLKWGIVGRDNWYGLGYETDEQCEAALAKFESGEAEISTRSNGTLVIARVEPAA